MDQLEPTRRTETHMVRGIKTTTGEEEGDRGRDHIRKTLLGLVWGPRGGVSGNGLYIAEGEISGNQNWGELPQDM